MTAAGPERSRFLGAAVALALVALLVWPVFAVGSLHRAWPYPVMLPDEITVRGVLYQRDEGCAGPASAGELQRLAAAGRVHRMGSIHSALWLWAPRLYGTQPESPTGILWVRGAGCLRTYERVGI